MNRALNIPIKISETLWHDPSFDKERFLTSQFVRAIAGHEDCNTFLLSVEVVTNEVA